MGNWFYQDLLSIIDTDKSSCLSRNWIEMPMISYIIASAFNCVVVLISNQLYVIFFPHSDSPWDNGIHRVVSLAHVRDNHFFKVKLRVVHHFLSLLCGGNFLYRGSNSLDVRLC